MTPYKLRPATELRNETSSSEEARKRRAHESVMKLSVEAIEKAHREGKTEVTVLDMTASVRAELRTAGYEVRDNRACGAGDMDSVTISWDK